MAMVAVKSMQHFRAAFEPITRQVVLVDTGALCSEIYPRALHPGPPSGLAARPDRRPASDPTLKARCWFSPGCQFHSPARRGARSQPGGQRRPTEERDFLAYLIVRCCDNRGIGEGSCEESITTSAFP